ncbi:hypothetical protein [Anaeromyxobacter oryzae]|uniref:DUF4190 domain-containing protein n=1 Tax=Anaeromyxobacter oryzae TaxID=2918170 RepID=A0ABM7WNL2_9BACT|nr:hypothetical protein [Anaeromyxobacter oryzae]BDG01059.1 hypothetical protein AMOR_00550 [Anaeromyxobacter oryzae]
MRPVEALLDRGNPLHWVVVVVLLVSGAACAWIGVRDGFVRRTMSTSGGRLVGGKAVAAGVLYVVTGLAGVAGALAFLLR